MTTHSQSNKAKGYVLTYNPQTNKNEFLKYTERSVHTKHGRMYYVETRSGYNIKVTDDHSLATVGTDSFLAPYLRRIRSTNLYQLHTRFRIQ